MRLQPESHWARRLEMVVPRKHNGVVQQILDGEAVLYDRRSARTHRMNETALSVWHGCDGRSTSRQLAEQITRMYDVPFDQALEDVEQAVAAFAQAGLVTTAEQQ